MKAIIYTKPTCPFCIKTKALLTQRGVEFEDHDVSANQALRAEISESVGGYDTVPMIFINGKFVGGNSDLEALDKAGKLG